MNSNVLENSVEHRTPKADEEIVQFGNVSKLYRLGLTRTSLPGRVAHFLRHPRRRNRVAVNRELWALKDVSFHVARGECVALIGPNGAGKTTALKLLSNITKATRGTITSRGRLAALLELGAGFHPELTGRENIYLNAAILGLGKAEVRSRFDEIVDFSGLQGFLETPLKRYSSGMAVRLGFSVASCIEPDILLVDEVLAVGDASFQQKCLRRIRALVEGGTAIIFVSHNLYMVRAICDRAIYLRHGELSAAGPTDDVIYAYEQDIEAERVSASPSRSSEMAASGSGLEITSVEVRAANNAADGRVFSSSEPASIVITYHSDRDVGPVNVSLFIRRSDGLACCMVRSRSTGEQFHLKAGTGTVSLCMERLQLIGGSYSVDAYFLNESDSLALTPLGGHSDWFQVRGTTLSSPQDSGVFEPLAKWSQG
jgi:lipopolysaccharide transport system ATP-binding protein